MENLTQASLLLIHNVTQSNYFTGQDKNRFHVKDADIPASEKPTD